MRSLLGIPSKALSCVLLCTLAACTSSGDSDQELPEEMPADPLSVWQFLSDKYDLNQDGVVDAEEYQREGAEIRILDRNGDGELSEEDFEEALISSEFERSRMAQYSLLEYFQDDDQPLNLTREECARSARFYDKNQDGRLTKLEFRASMAERHRNLLRPEWRENPPNPMPRIPWAELRAGIDVDRDKTLTFEEIDRFFMDNAIGREVWNAERYRNFPLKPGFESLSGPRVGEVAPDFTLTPIDNGFDVTLSSFKGQRPVALIFGSYT